MSYYDNEAVSNAHYQVWKYFNTDEFTLTEAANVTGIEKEELFHHLGMLCGWRYFKKNFYTESKFTYNMTPEGAGFASANWGHKLKEEGQ